MQQWMMKAKEFGEPVQLPSHKEERGWYYFFDVHNWRRERVSASLHGFESDFPLSLGRIHINMDGRAD